VAERRQPAEAHAELAGLLTSMLLLLLLVLEGLLLLLEGKLLLLLQMDRLLAVRRLRCLRARTRDFGRLVVNLELAAIELVTVARQPRGQHRGLISSASRRNAPVKEADCDLRVVF
jgi:hypothetical protein